jgi:hypothetical protein
MKQSKRTIEVIIDKISVDEGYYDIDYHYSINGGKSKKGNYNSDYEGWTIKQWKETLESGEALDRVFQTITE